MGDKKERISIFIDGSNFYHNIKKLLKENERINYQKLIQALVKDRRLINSFYYVASLDPKVNFEKYQKHEDFLNVLRQIPKFNVVLCSLKKIKIDDEFIYLVKGDDVKMAHDMLMGAVDDLYDVAIIVSGDEDFHPLIKTIKERYKKTVENAYIRSSSSYKLRKACNPSLNISKILSKIIDKK